MSDYDYDVFITYSRVDSAWAQALETELSSKQITAFLDHTRLTPGARWAPQLIGSLQRSRHLVVLWSQAAKDSDWVQQELNRFRQIIDPTGNGLAGDRRIFLVLLEGENRSHSDVQTLANVSNAGSYAAGAAAAGREWTDVVSSIADTVQADDGSLAIPLLLVTSTRARMDALDPAREPAAGKTLQQLVGELGIESVEALRDSYGTTRSDWRPFGSDRSVVAILEELKDGLNAVITQDGNRPRLRWDYVGDDFWTSPDAAERESRRLSTSSAVVVIDPISFYDDLVVNRYANFLPDVLLNERAFILVLAPFALPPTARAFRDAIRAFARQVFMHFYEPPAFRGRVVAGCSASVGDEIEFRGWLMAALASRAAPAQSGAVTYLRVT